MILVLTLAGAAQYCVADQIEQLEKLSMDYVDNKMQQEYVETEALDNNGKNGIFDEIDSVIIEIYGFIKENPSEKAREAHRKVQEAVKDVYKARDVYYKAAIEAEEELYQEKNKGNKQIELKYEQKMNNARVEYLNSIDEANMKAQEARESAREARALLLTEENNG